jgi:hypothetical protein
MTEKRYFNRAQREVMLVDANRMYIIGARGLGKSEGMDAPRLLRCVTDMPRSTGAMLSPTYQKAWANTLPAICKALVSFGYYQDVHYVVGKKAPSKLGFAQPRRPPLADGWSNCIHFWNGSVMVVLSFSGNMSANSMSLDWIIAPEAKFLNYQKIKSEVSPANRGNREYDYSYLHHSEYYSTDMPTSRSGHWILDKENEMDREHVLLIKQTYREWQQCKATSAGTRREKELLRDLKMLRNWMPVKSNNERMLGKKRDYTTFYAEYDVFENIEILGENFVWQMKRDLPALLFRTSILNERLYKVADGFYSALEENIHFYVPRDNDRLQQFGSNFTALEKSGCLGDSDLDFSKPLHIAFDSNSAINSLIVAQIDEDTHTMRVVRSLFVKTPQKIMELVEKFCEHYNGFITREIVIYYDHTFVWTNGISGDSLIKTITDTLEKKGWNRNTAIYVGLAPSHKWKHEQIDLTLKGAHEKNLFISINSLHNEYLKIAMERTGTQIGRNGFEKNKSEERLPDSPELPNEIKTHITDAFDTLWYGINYHFNGLSANGFSSADLMS